MKEKIKCPNCGHDFDVEQAISDKLKADIRKDFAQQQAQFDKAKQEFEENKEKARKDYQERLANDLEKETKRLEAEASKKVELEMQMLKKEQKEKDEELRALKRQELEFAKREKEWESKEEDLRLKLERELLNRQRDIESKAKAEEREKQELRVKELELKLEKQRELTEEMNRKMEQGSMQLQGEVQEIVLEEKLQDLFPFDRVEEVPKGKSGADCIQTVINERQEECGSIVYESKRTKAFSASWIPKLREDQLNVKADLAVIVSQKLPEGIKGFGLYDGVWICSFSYVENLAIVLRQMILKLSESKASEENKGDKMVMLYDYLLSAEFKQTFENIVATYNTMQSDLQSEKRAMTRIWKSREKQMELIQNNLVGMFGSIKGIAGTHLPDSDLLALPEES